MTTGGSSGPTRYAITVEDTDNGAVESSRTRASRGTTVTLTVTPDEGYALDSLTVTDRDGDALELTDKGDGKYTFEMPRSRVTVEAVFAAVIPDYAACDRGPDCPLRQFTDVDGNAWYHDGLHYCLEKGLMAGTSNTTFAPDTATSRAMIATILWRMADSPVVNYAMSYTDVAEGSWYGEAVRWATSEGIVSGYGGGRFGPDDPITREQMAVMLWRFAQEQGYDVSARADLSGYTDAGTVSGYAAQALQWAVGEGIIGGTGEDTLSPQGQAARAQAAVMLMRFIQSLATA